MRSTGIWLVSLLLLAGCTRSPESAPPTREASAAPAAPTNAARVPKRYDIGTLLSNLRLVGADMAPDGSRVLFSSNASGVFNLYEIPASGGEATALTASTGDAHFAVGYFPADGRILYTADRGGDERNHLYVRETDGSTRDLTPCNTCKAEYLDWSDDKTGVFVMTNERDARFFDVYEIAATGYARSLLLQNTSGDMPVAVSRDRRYVALSRANTTNDSDIVLHDRSTGEFRTLTAHDGVESNDAMGFAPDGGLLYTSNRGGEFSRLMHMDLASGQTRVLYETGWDVVRAEYTPDDRRILVYVNADARTRLVLLDAATLAPVALPAVPSGDVTGVDFSDDGSRLAFFVASSRSPASLWSAALGGEAHLLVQALNPAVDPEDLVEGEVVRFASYDGLEVPGILYIPQGASKEAPVPAMVWVHGGPGGQSRLSYSALIQYLVNHGYAVYAINNRGSSGYGKTFFAADDRRHGEADLDDVVASRGMLAATGRVDPARIGIIGGSYGGYMTAAALAFRPDAFALGVNIFGVTNWIRTLESIPPWWEAQRKALYAELGDPAADRERLTRISPLFHASNIRRPLMVLQGANDPRVLQVESDEIVAAVRANGVPVEYIVFPDEGHGFVKRENEQRGYEAVLAFLDRHMAGAGAAH